jgi:hypothetical protein
MHAPEHRPKNGERRPEAPFEWTREGRYPGEKMKG